MNQNKKIKQGKNYISLNFIDDVLRGSGLKIEDDWVLQQIRGEILKALLNKVNEVVVEAFDEDKADLVKNLLVDHDELEFIDAVFLIAVNDEVVSDRLKNAVEELKKVLIGKFAARIN